MNQYPRFDGIQEAIKEEDSNLKTSHKTFSQIDDEEYKRSSVQERTATYKSITTKQYEINEGRTHIDPHLKASNRQLVQSINRSNTQITRSVTRVDDEPDAH